MAAATAAIANAVEKAFVLLNSPTIKADATAPIPKPESTIPYMVATYLVP